MYQEEFEQFLQDEVKQHRMYPSDHVWRNIRTELHGYRSWPALTFISVFIVTALTLSTVLTNKPDKHLLEPANYANVLKAYEAAEKASLVANEKSQRYFHSLSPAQINVHTIEAISLPDNRQNFIAAATVAPANLSEHTSNVLRTGTPREIMIHMPQPMSFTEQESASSNNNTAAASMTATAETNQPTQTANEIISASNDHENDPSADAFLKDFKYVQVVNKPKTSKLGFQIYFTPSTSYRKLSDEKVKEIVQRSSSAISTPVPSTTDVNRVVRHRPAMGMELGFAMLYRINKRLTFKTGVQLNIRQYEIETFQSLTNDPTTISLINYGGVQNITLYSPYNNNVGYKQTQLNNKVFQLSVPLGIQWEVLQGKHFSINTEASVQPTLNLNRNVYVLSTDYKHYANGSEFVRKWNINTNVGLNISYRTGATTWQIGPQVRYQHLSTYSNKYPIKEYLMDYGLRIGFTKSFQ